MNNIQKIFCVVLLIFLICMFVKLREPFSPNAAEFIRRLKLHKDKWPSANSGGIGKVKYQSPFYLLLTS